MTQIEIQQEQIKMWIKLTAEFIEKISEKPEDEIVKKDIIKIAQRIEALINVLNGVSKIDGWRN